MIEVQGLTRKYGGAVAVDALSFTVRPGQVTALIGPNGAGKSTALRLMLQLERGRGSTFFAGRRYRELRHPAREVGVWLGAEPADPRRRARTELRVAAAAHGIKRARVDEVLDLVGLAPVAGVRVGALSTGARGRLGIATALLGDPHTLILDEPSAGQDPEGARWLREFLRAYVSQGRTVLVAGHGLTELADCADHVLAMSRGRLWADEAVLDYRARADGHEVFVRTPQVERLVELLRAEGLAVHVHGGTVLSVTADRARIGEIAFRNGVLLHELAQRETSVADAFCTVAARNRAATESRVRIDQARHFPRSAERAERRAAREDAKLAKRTKATADAYERLYDPAADVTSPPEGVIPASAASGPADTDASVSAIPGPAQASRSSDNRSPHRRPKRRRWLARSSETDAPAIGDDARNRTRSDGVNV